MKHKKVLLSDEVKRKFNLNEREIVAAATLPELDDAYTRKIHNFPSTYDMYKWSSCINYLTNIEKPIIFINALDDPLVPEVLLQPIRDFTGNAQIFFAFGKLLINLFFYIRIASKSFVHRMSTWWSPWVL